MNSFENNVCYSTLKTFKIIELNSNISLQSETYDRKNCLIRITYTETFKHEYPLKFQPIFLGL